MNKKFLLGITLLLGPTAVLAAEEHSAAMHQQHMMAAAAPTLSEAGNDAFGTIQEVIAALNADPATDWDKVDLEALRQHLVDMHDMTMNVEVLSQTAIPDGMEAVIRPTTARASLALARVLAVHPAQLQRETNWIMEVERDGDEYRLRTTSANPADASRIRGLGYIGLMAWGAHHQPHHWAMAKGDNPHAGHE